MWINGKFSLSYFNVEQLLTDQHHRKLTLHLGRKVADTIQGSFFAYLNVILPEKPLPTGSHSVLDLLRAMYFLNDFKTTFLIKHGHYYGVCIPESPRSHRWRYLGNMKYEQIKIDDNGRSSSRTIQIVKNVLSRNLLVPLLLEVPLFQPEHDSQKWVNSLRVIVERHDQIWKEFNSSFCLSLGVSRNWREIVRNASDCYLEVKHTLDRSSGVNRYALLNSSKEGDVVCMNKAEGWYLTYR